VSLAGKDAQIFVTGGSQSMSNEDCDPIGSGSPVLQWQIGDSDLNIWDPSATFSVEVSTDGGSTWTTASTSNYSLRYLVGVVEFDSDPFSGSTSGNDVRIASGNYLPYYAVLDGYEQEVGFERELYDTTSFQDTGMARGATGPLDVTGSFSMHEMIERELDSDGGSEPTLREILRGEETHGTSGDIDEYRVYRAQPDNSESSLVAAWFKFTDESLDASVGSKQEREFSMEATNRAAAMSSQTAKVGDILTY